MYIFLEILFKKIIADIFVTLIFKLQQLCIEYLLWQSKAQLSNNSLKEQGNNWFVLNFILFNLEKNNTKLFVLNLSY